MVAKNLRPRRLHNTRYFRRIAERKQLHDQARRVVHLVNTGRTKIAAVVVGLAVMLLSLGAGGAAFVRWWLAR
jgi:hypothetical protein